jgi:hypothetical protein
VSSKSQAYATKYKVSRRASLWLGPHTWDSCYSAHTSAKLLRTVGWTMLHVCRNLRAQSTDEAGTHRDPDDKRKPTRIPRRPYSRAEARPAAPVSRHCAAGVLL